MLTHFTCFKSIDRCLLLSLRSSAAHHKLSLKIRIFSSTGRIESFSQIALNEPDHQLGPVSHPTVQIFSKFLFPLPSSSSLLSPSPQFKPKQENTGKHCLKAKPKLYLSGWLVSILPSSPSQSMAALGIRFGGSEALRSGDDLWQNHRQLPHRKNARPIRISSQIGSDTKMMWKLKSQSESESELKSKPRLCLEGFGGGKNEALAREKMDEWMRDSVAEIVKNLRGAPLLVEVYSDRNGGGTRLKTEKAVAQDWPLIQSNWKIDEAQSPEGVILVEELAHADDGDGDGDGDDDDEITGIWGVVIQGKGTNCGPCCYLLKTSRVNSNLGFYCTHFCLMKVKSFRETAQSQFKNSWLVR